MFRSLRLVLSKGKFYQGVNVNVHQSVLSLFQIPLLFYSTNLHQVLTPSKLDQFVNYYMT